MRCCKTPQLRCFDVSERTEYSHTLCHSCGAHKFGLRGKEKFYTKQEWETWVNSKDYA